MSVLLAIPSAHAEWHGATESLMGTRITVRLWHTNAEIGTDAVQEVLAEISRIERLMSTYMAESSGPHQSSLPDSGSLMYPSGRRLI